MLARRNTGTFFATPSDRQDRMVEVAALGDSGVGRPPATPRTPPTPTTSSFLVPILTRSTQSDRRGGHVCDPGWRQYGSGDHERWRHRLGVLSYTLNADGTQSKFDSQTGRADGASVSGVQRDFAGWVRAVRARNLFHPTCRCPAT